MLKHLNDLHLQPNLSVREQFYKVVEESEEVIEAFTENKTGHEKAQELLDLILSSMNLLKKMERDDLITISEEIKLHKAKIEFYISTGKYDFKDEEVL